MNILVYFPTNKRSVSIETVVEYFVRKGHNVHFLGQEEKGEIHENIERVGATVYTYVIPKSNALVYYVKHIVFLVRFIRLHKIQLVYSHLQQPNLIASIAQYFTDAVFVLCRHHSDIAFIYNNKKEQRADKIINTLGKHFVVPSGKVLHQMISEGVSRERITQIPYAYDFEKYPKPSVTEVEKIRSEYKASLLLVIVSRLVKDKRHRTFFEVVNTLISKGLDIKVVALGEGEERKSLQKFIDDHGLKRNIFLVGFKSNVIDYLQAADAIVHLSVSEASNSVIKEAGLLKKLVLVCSDVGDFDDYLRDGITGIALEKENPSGKLEHTLSELYGNRSKYEKLGDELQKKILKLYASINVLPLYDKLHEQLFNGKSN